MIRKATRKISTKRRKGQNAGSRRSSPSPHASERTQALGQKPQAPHGLEEKVKQDPRHKTWREYVLWGVGSAAVIVILALVSNYSGTSSLSSRPNSDEATLSDDATIADQATTSTDEEIISATKAALKSTDVDVRGVKITDGRSKGGERAMVITYAHSFDQSERIPEVVKVLESGYAANQHSRAEIESVVVMVSDKQGRTKAIIGVKAADVRWFMETKDSPGYLKRWTVALFDRRFLPRVAREMGW